MPSEATICENRAGKISYASSPSRNSWSSGNASDGHELDRGVDDRDAISFHAPDDGDATVAHLGEEKRVADVDRHLVTQLRRAEGVTDQKHVGHGDAAYR